MPLPIVQRHQPVVKFCCSDKKSLYFSIALLFSVIYGTLVIMNAEKYQEEKMSEPSPQSWETATSKLLYQSVKDQVNRQSDPHNLDEEENLANQIIKASDDRKMSTRREALRLWRQRAQGTVALLKENITSVRVTEEDKIFIENGKRAMAAEENCEPTEHQLGYKMGLIYDLPTEHLAYCLSHKVATRYMLNYLIELSGIKRISHNIGLLLQRYEVLHKRETDIRDSFALVIVRQPFRRTVSAYCNRMIAGYIRGYDKMKHDAVAYRNKATEDVINHHSISRNSIRKSGFRVEDPHEVDPIAYFLRKHPDAPTFREFVMFCAMTIFSCNGNLSCLMKIFPLTRPQRVHCNPCKVNFDFVMKLENMNEEFAFIQNWFNLLDLDEKILRAGKRNKMGPGEVMVQINSTENTTESSTSKTVKLNATGDKCTSYEALMSQLTELEVDLLYTAYYMDYKLFDYTVMD